MKLTEIDLIPGADGSDAAFDRAKIEATGNDSMSLSESLANALSGFAYLLAENRGFAVIVNDDGDASITGLKLEIDA